MTDHPALPRSFRWLLLGRSVVSLSDAVMPVALGFAILDVTGSVGSLATVLSCAVGARMVALPLAGVLVDRYDLRRLACSADLVRCGVQAFVGVQLLSGRPGVTAIAAMEVLAGVASAISMCAASPLVAAVVRDERARQRANALMATGQETALLLGPLAAGGIVLTVSPGWVFLIDALAFGLGAATFAAIRTHRGPAGVRGASAWADLATGWKEIRSRNWYWITLVAHGGVNFADQVLITLGPLTAARHHGEAVRVARVHAGGVGLLGGSLLASRFRPRRPLFIGNAVLAVFALPLTLFAVWAPAPLIVAAYGVSWAVLGAVSPFWATLVQARIPHEALARVTSYGWLSSLAAQSLALLFAPLAVAAWGSIHPALVTAALLVVALCVASASTSAVRRVGPPDTTAATGAELLAYGTARDGAA